MNPPSLIKARGLLLDYNKNFAPSKKEKNNNKKIVVCPPSVYYHIFDELRIRNVKLGSQNFFDYRRGYMTGQISSKMLKNFGVEYCLVGHSELRQLGETEDDMISKIKELLKNYITPIVFIGYIDYLKELKYLLNNLNAEEINKIILVFEPKSYIGRNQPLLEEKLIRAIREIKKMIYYRFKRGLFSKITGMGGKKQFIPHPPILYGGSININNYKRFLEITDLMGFVLGRESMNPENVKKIYNDLI